ncbi:hypothetical protein E2C01_014831 [Portunus trituberculatus]|uniref:Uncharacterized protein n=1 Tax=Portunus trituberculatus TaxID=210409 RepID=A0A5B7DK38_PORTR|nr:hypothetical protein [Portunus trituberculatus]
MLAYVVMWVTVWNACNAMVKRVIDETGLFNVEREEDLRRGPQIYSEGRHDSGKVQKTEKVEEPVTLLK